MLTPVRIPCLFSMAILLLVCAVACSESLAEPPPLSQGSGQNEKSTGSKSVSEAMAALAFQKEQEDLERDLLPDDRLREQVRDQLNKDLNQYVTSDAVSYTHLRAHET